MTLPATETLCSPPPAWLALVGRAPEGPEVAAALRAKGHRVAVYEDLAAAESDLPSDPPDLVVCQADLPDGSGLDLVAQLRAMRRPEHLGLVVLTPRADEAEVLRAYAAGADDCLVQPVSPAVLVAKVTRLLARLTPPPLFPDGPAEPGDVLFGRYEVTGVLGTGSYGVVYAATDRAGGAEVALKVLAGEAAEQPEARLRFFRETYALSALGGPHLIRVLEVGARGGTLFYAMERVDGPTLAERVRARGPATEPEARALLRGIARALVALEDADLVHRDLKPQNVILRGGEYADAVLIDLGLAKHPFDRGLTSPGMLLGTPGYMAPEYLRDERVDRRADLFALGLVARFALTGEEHLSHLQGLALVQRMARERVPFPAQLSPELRALLERLTALAPDDRPSSAREVLAALSADG